MEGLPCGDGRQRWRPGRLKGEIQRDCKRTRLLRMRMEFGAGGLAELFPLGGQDSHMLSNLAHANALIKVDRGDGVMKDSEEVLWTDCP